MFLNKCLRKVQQKMFTIENDGAIILGNFWAYHLTITQTIFSSGYQSAYGEAYNMHIHVHLP